MRYLIFTAFGLLAACSTPQDMAATCQGYGFTPGTNSFAQCMQNERLAQDARKARMSKALGNMSASQSKMTTCRDLGGGVLQCSTF
jgi:hypothetical protein